MANPFVMDKIIKVLLAVELSSRHEVWLWAQTLNIKMWLRFKVKMHSWWTMNDFDHVNIIELQFSTKEISTKHQFGLCAS